MASLIFVVFEYSYRLLTQNIPSHRYAPRLQLFSPVSELWPFVEAYIPSVLIPCCANQCVDARPGNGAKTHGAGFCTGVKLIVSATVSSKIKGAEPLLSQGESDNFRMKYRAPTGYHSIHAYRYKGAEVIKDGGAKGPSGAVYYILSGELYRQFHPA
jgi:hypothetical protein